MNYNFHTIWTTKCHFQPNVAALLMQFLLHEMFHVKYWLVFAHYEIKGVQIGNSKMLKKPGIVKSKF